MKKYYRLNQNISGTGEVRVVDEKGKQLGVMSLADALARAREVSLDLVEIAKDAKPPVVKIVDFKKFKYEEEKKERLSRRKTKEIETKEIWLSPFISEHDLNIHLERAREFLEDGDRVKLTVKFAGRQIAHPEFGYKVLEKAVEALTEVAEKDGEPRMMGRSLTLSLKPVKNNSTRKS